jgi:hypothetical protein
MLIIKFRIHKKKSTTLNKICLEGRRTIPMAVFEGDVLRQTSAVAQAHKIEPAALLAVVEVESAGKSLEVDGRTPCLLFERHIFYRELNKLADKTKLNKAVALGLANKTWQPKTQYKDQNTSQARLNLIARAKAVDPECTYRSASWGVGQTMGFVAEETGFASATAMYNYMVMGGVPAQVECMVREINVKKLIPKLNTHAWAAFAVVYNGPGYKTNNYDSKMASAYLKWKQVELPRAGAADAPLPKPVASPTPFAPPVPDSATSRAAGPPVKVAAVGVAAATGGLWTAWDSFEHQLLGLAILVIALAAVTAIIVWHRRQAGAVAPKGILSAQIPITLAPAVAAVAVGGV